MPRSRAAYAPEFWQKMVELVHAGRSPEELAKEFASMAQAIRNWVARSEGPRGKRAPLLSSAECEEPGQLRKENRKLKLEREILAKATVWFAREAGTTPRRSSGS